MGVTLNVIFNRLNLKTVKGLYPLHIRVTIDRKTDYLHTGINIKKEHWLGKENKWVKETHSDNFEMNKRIKVLKDRLSNYIWQLINNDKSININVLKDFHKKKTDSKILNQYVDDFIKSRKWSSLTTRRTYVTFQKHLDAFNNNIKFSELNENLVKDFLSFLEKEKKLMGSSIKKNKDKFTAIAKEAVKEGLLDVNNNPFFYSDIKVKTQKSSRTFLDLEEVLKIKTLIFSEEQAHLDKYRWHFIFLCCSGLYYNDLKKLKWESLGKTELGYYINDKRFKNSENFQIPLYKFKSTTHIIEDYGDKTSEFVFPDTIEDQPFNRQLKKIAKMAGIKKNIYNKVGRHTYAQLMIKLGIERQFLSRMMGHQKEETTSHYYNISMHDLEDKIKDLNFNDLGL